MTERNLTGYPSIDRPWRKYYSEEALNALLPEGSMYDYMTACNAGQHCLTPCIIRASVTFILLAPRHI